MHNGDVEGAVQLASEDGEFLLNVMYWTGSFSLRSGREIWQVLVEDGLPKLSSNPGAGQAGRQPRHDIVVSGTDAAWGDFLAATPCPPCTDIFGACMNGNLTIEPLPDSAPLHNALRRLGELLRLAHTATTDSHSSVQEPRRHGQFDAATGRYIHLRLLGVEYRVYFEEAGEGIGLLCQHTAGSDGRQWRHLLEDGRVTGKYRVIAYDLPYHGKSLPPTGRSWWAEEYRLTTAAAMALPVALADALGLDRPAFIGSSIGGMLALDLARYHPDRFRAVVSLEGGLHSPIPSSPEVAELAHRTLTTDRLIDPARHAARMPMVMAPTAPAACRHETMFHYAQGAPGVFPGDMYYYSVDHDLRGQGALIDTDRCPVYLLAGEYDYGMVPVTEQAAKEIPGSRLQIMSGLGHFPMSEDYDQLMAYVLPVLDNIAQVLEVGSND